MILSKAVATSNHGWLSPQNSQLGCLSAYLFFQFFFLSRLKTKKIGTCLFASAVCFAGRGEKTRTFDPLLPKQMR